MLSHEIHLLVTCLLITLASAIRVDWNTNQGPIVPPTPRTTVRPQPPYREPAPVWEDQSNDIPNPNPYMYVLPPPSRPRPATNNYLTFDRQPATFNNNFGNIVAPSAVNAYFQNGNGHVVASLSPKYVPNVGVKYAAVVPKKYNSNNNNNGELSGGYYSDKFQGKYNAKTKKYKAYEKVKYNVPLNYYPMFEMSLPEEQKYVPEFDSQQMVRTQQLPLPQVPQPFKASVVSVKSPQQQQQQTRPAKVAHDKEIGEKSKDAQKSTKKPENPKFTSANAIFPTPTKKSS